MDGLFYLRSESVVHLRIHNLGYNPVHARLKHTGSKKQNQEQTKQQECEKYSNHLKSLKTITKNDLVLLIKKSLAWKLKCFKFKYLQYVWHDYTTIIRPANMPKKALTEQHFVSVRSSSGSCCWMGSSPVCSDATWQSCQLSVAGSDRQAGSNDRDSASAQSHNSSIH